MLDHHSRTRSLPLGLFLLQILNKMRLFGQLVFLGLLCAYPALAGAQTFEETMVLLAQSQIRDKPPTLVAYTGSITEGLTEVWRAEGGESSWRDHLDSPIIADVDNDGYNEIIAVDRHRLLIWHPPSTEPDIFEINVRRKSSFSALAVGDLNQDGLVEIAVGIRNHLTILNYQNGFELIDEIDLAQLIDIRTMEIGSVESHAYNRLFVGGQSETGDTTFTARNQDMKRFHTYDLVPTWEYASGDMKLIGHRIRDLGSVISPVGRITSLRLYDLTGDGINEVIISGMDHSAEMRNSRLFPVQGIVAWTYDSINNRYIKIAQLQNSWQEISMPDTTKRYYPLYESVASSIGNGVEAMNVGDLDADGRPEIVTVSFGSYVNPAEGEKPRVSILTYDRGEFIFRHHEELPGGYSHFGGVAIGDLDGDGSVEFTDSGRYLMQWDTSRKTIVRIPLPSVLANYVTIGSIRIK